MKKILILINSVVYNRGSEALIRGLSKICKNSNSDIEITLVSNEKNFGSWVNIENIDNYIKRNNKRNLLARLMLKISRILKLRKLVVFFEVRDLKNVIQNKNLIIVIGADNFDKSYNMQEKLTYLHTYIKNNSNAKMLLYDCSFNETDVTDTLLKDIANFDVMTVRETISEKTIKENYKGNTEIALFPDPAFVMDREEVDLPRIFEEKVVGINVSNLITNASYGSNSEKVLTTYKKMMDYILNDTSYNIVLVPHVMNNADLSALRVLYSEYKDNSRVYLIEDETLNAKQLKYIISKCSLYIGARTHSTIAAYSTCVPTLVLGYSVKSKGIAKDIFGTYENYVLPVDKLDSEDYLLDGFKWLDENKENIRNTLKQKMPEYIKRAEQTGKVINKYLGE